MTWGINRVSAPRLVDLVNFGVLGFKSSFLSQWSTISLSYNVKACVFVWLCSTWHYMLYLKNVVLPRKYTERKDVLLVNEGRGPKIWKSLLLTLNLHIVLLILHMYGKCIGVRMGEEYMCTFAVIHVSIHVHMFICSLKVISDLLGGYGMHVTFSN